MTIPLSKHALESVLNDPPRVRRFKINAVPDDAELTGHTPHISAGCFCDSVTVAKTLRTAMEDRRLSRATTHFASGGIEAAVAFYADAPTPDLLILETTLDGGGILAALDELSRVCDVNTKVVVIGRMNDIGLYRAMIAKGVSDYLVAPVDTLAVIAAILRLYPIGSATRLGRICAFLGAKGGVGASTLAQNVAWRIGQDRKGPVMLADLDLQFGTAALNLNLMPSNGFVEQTMDPDRLDEVLLERSLIQKGKFLHVLPASGRMREIESPDPVAVAKLLDLSRQAFPVVILDLPHLQSPWMKAVLAAVDDLVIVAAPDLANLRNAKCLFDIFRAARPNDPLPRLVLNQLGLCRRAGVSPADFAKTLDVEIKTQISFDPNGLVKASNEGRLVTESTPRCAASRMIAALAKDIDTRPAQGGQFARPKGRGFRWPWSSDD